MLRPTLLSLLMICLLTTHAPAAPTARPAAAVVTLKGEVDNYTRDLLFKQFADARTAGATTVIVVLDTPGGLVTSALEITSFLRGQTDLHTVAYVRKAYSAGSMIAVSCNEIVMAPSAAIGDCAPIIFKSDGSLDPMPTAERAKAQSPVLADFDASADRNGYDRLLLESMVVAERVVYYVQPPPLAASQSETVDPQPAKRFVDEAEHKRLLALGWTDVPGLPVPIDGPETLLTVYTDEAVKLGLATGVAPSPEALAATRNLPVVADLSPGSGEAIVGFLNNALVRGLLMMLLSISLWVCLGSPGHGAAEAIAILCLGLLVGVPLLTGYAQWWQVILIFAGLALLAFEIFVFPGHGVSAVAGVAMMLGGLLLTFVGREPGPDFIPHMAGTWTALRDGSLALAGGLTGAVALSFWLRQYLPRLPYFRRLILTTPSGDVTAIGTEPPPAANHWPGVGTAGTVVTELKPGGLVSFVDLSLDTRTVAVVSESGYIPPGEPVIVRESRGNHIVVRRVTV